MVVRDHGEGFSRNRGANQCYACSSSNGFERVSTSDFRRNFECNSMPDFNSPEWIVVDLDYTLELPSNKLTTGIEIFLGVGSSDPFRDSKCLGLIAGLDEHDLLFAQRVDVRNSGTFRGEQQTGPTTLSIDTEKAALASGPSCSKSW